LLVEPPDGPEEEDPEQQAEWMLLRGAGPLLSTVPMAGRPTATCLWLRRSSPGWAAGWVYRAQLARAQGKRTGKRLEVRPSTLLLRASIDRANNIKKTKDPSTAISAKIRPEMIFHRRRTGSFEP